MEQFIEFQSVSFSYDTDEETPGKNVLTDFSLQVKKGDFIAILGHNGCGKSTVAKLCNGIELPQQGRVLVDGMDTREENNILPIRKRVGMVFQNPDNQIVATIVEDDVAFGPENLGVPPDEIRRRVDDALKRVGMYDFRFFEPHKLSGGQKQRVAIAGVIAMHPECIILDEPTAMLDPQGRKDVMATVEMLNRDFGITIIFITHYMDEAARANRVLVMNEGAVLLDGPPKQVFQKEAVLKQAGLDIPQATRLAAMLRRDGFDIARDVLSMEDLTASLLPLCETPTLSVTADDTALENEPAEPVVPSSEIVLETCHLTHVYAKGTTAEVKAVDDVSAVFRSGELVGIIGHTGSGKSTFIEHLNGLLKGTDGVVLLEGRDIWAEKKKIRAVRFKVGVCFQYPEYQLFEETVEKDIAFGPKNMGLSDDEIARRVRTVLGYVGLDDSYLQQSPFDLSGGEKRRVAIAGIMAMEPQVLVLDEPCAGLDPRGRTMVLDLIRSYRAQTGCTVLLVSHSMEDVAGICSRILVMNRAKLAYFDTVQAVFSHAAQLTQMGLDVPQITRLFLLLRERGCDLRTDIFDVTAAHSELLRLLKGGACP